MSMMLPKEINYNLPVSLPGGVSKTDVNLSPINGTNFSCQTAGQIMQWDLPATGFMDGKTLSIRYKTTCVSTGLTKIRACPLYTPMSRLEVIFGSQVAQNITDYGQVQNMVTNLTYNVAQKLSLTGLGYKLEGDDKVMTLQGTDGRHCVGGETNCLFGPLPCILSEADRYIPLLFMPVVRLQITLDSISNIFAPVSLPIALNLETGTPFTNASVVPSDFIISDAVLSYTSINFGEETSNIVRSMGDTIKIKSQSFGNSSQTIPINTSGEIELVYSQRLASIKSLFLHCSSTSTNGKFDAFEVTTNGSVQFNIASRVYPSSRPLSSAVAHRGTLLLELKKAIGGIYDKNNSMSINQQEYLTLGQASTLVNPAKVYYGCNTQVIQSNNVLLSGVSTQNSPITARLNILFPTLATVNASLITAYDVLIEVEPASRSARVIM